jgi:hypothetical protein
VISGIDPCKILIGKSRMREHVLNCLQNGIISSFPKLSFRSVRKQIVRTTSLPLYCSCRSSYVLVMPWFSVHNVLPGVTQRVYRCMIRRLKDIVSLECSLCARIASLSVNQSTFAVCFRLIFFLFHLTCLLVMFFVRVKRFI